MDANPYARTSFHRSARNARSDRNPETRIGRHVQIDKATGCWLYNGVRDQYAVVNRTTKGDPIAAHRFVYETLVGPIPEGHHLHHECENKGCVNPDHLTPLTPTEHAQAHAALRKRTA